MGKDGWLTLSWPKEFGGQARPPMDGLIFNDEASIANVPVPFLTINSVAPTIMAFGTDEQKKFFLPKIAAGELHFSIGYSEPGAGTDLAALRTTAVRDGDDYVVNGQKMWTQPDRLRRLRVAGGAHQPRGQEAPRHLDADHADHRRGLLLDARAHHVRRRHQRHLLPGRPRSRRATSSARRTAAGSSSPTSSTTSASPWSRRSRSSRRSTGFASGRRTPRTPTATA